MKKTVLSLVSFCAILSVTAQTQYSVVSAKKDRNSLVSVKAKPATSTQKAEGDVIWSDDFTTTSNWTATNDPAGTPPHTQGDWAIVNALPASLVSQAPGQGFPSAMLSTSGGNFALVDSDGAGPSATQNAFIATASNISVATLLSNNGSAPNAPLYLKFTEIYRHFQETFSVDISIDGGTTWTEFIANPLSEVPVNTNSGNPEVEVINVTSVIGAGNWTDMVRVRFHYRGNYDWFWGVDDVQLVEAFQNDVKINNLYQATDITTTQGLDYHIVPTSQTSFPGLTFGAYATNNGGANQPTVGLNATSGAYNETSATVAIAPGVTDTLAITVPFALPAAVGDYTVNITTTLGAATDSDAANNTSSLVIRRDAHLYGRDNGVATGAIAQVSSQNDAELKIGNLMEIFNDMDVYSVEVRLVQQAAAVGQEINAEIFILDQAGTLSYLGQTENHVITNGDLSNFVKMQVEGAPLSLSAGDVILLMAHHYGGANEVGFALAQPTYEGTVLGYTAGATDPFQLTSPNAVMIRLNDQNNLSVSENEAKFDVNVYPNPSTDASTVSFNLDNTSDVAVTVTDLSGKTVYATALTNAEAGKHEVSVNTASLAAGVYSVNFTANATVITKKLVVKK